MIVAIIALIVAIGGSAAALPGKFSVGRDDLKNGSVGARALGKMYLGHVQVLRSSDPVANDGEFTESRGAVLCPRVAPTALDPSIGRMGPKAFEADRRPIPNRWGAPRGYEFFVLSDEGPEIGYAMTVNCLFTR